MKTIYNVKALCVVALLGSATTMRAQDDTSKEKNLNREMTLEREYDPSVQDASKVNTLPTVKEPEVKKMPISFATYTAPADPQKEIGLLPSGSIMTEMNYNKRRGYFNLGLGTYMNINGDFGYHILSTEKDQLNVSLSHRSTNGKVKYIQYDEKVKAKLNDNLGGIRFKHAFENLSLNLGAQYGYSAFNYYGLPMEQYNGSSAPYQTEADRSTNQVAQQIMFTTGIESKEDAPASFLLALDYTNFSYKYGISPLAGGPAENDIRLRFDLNAAFSGNRNHRIGFAGKVAYLAYNLPARVQSATQSYGSSFENFAIGTVSPYYKIEGNNWNVKLGVNLMFVTGMNKMLAVSPNITADIEVADKTVLYAQATGEQYTNSLYEVSQINRYLDPTTQITPSQNWLNAQLGIKSGIAANFWFDIFGGYKITANNYFFQPSRGYNPNDFGNMSHTFDNLDTKQLFIGANLKYSYQQLFDINLKGVYNHWNARMDRDWIPGNSDTKAYGMPKMEITAGLNVRPIDKVTLALDYYLATDRYAHLFGSKDYKLNNINELNLTGSYTFNDTFGAYLKVTNLLAQKYELLYGYPMQSISAMVGVNINF